MTTETADRLTALGFTRAAEIIKELKKQKRKLVVACEHYRIVRQEHIDRFNKALYGKTDKNGEYKRLSFCDIAAYQNAPPEEVLMALEAAQARKCFDNYQIAYIVEVKDPLLFGQVDGSSLRFFIAQWDDDVKIEDILKENEG